MSVGGKELVEHGVHGEGRVGVMCSGGWQKRMGI